VHGLINSRWPSRGNITLWCLAISTHTETRELSSRSIAKDHDHHRYMPTCCIRSQSHLGD
jgi:hypothetical protein